MLFNKMAPDAFDKSAKWRKISSSHFGTISRMLLCIKIQFFYTPHLRTLYSKENIIHFSQRHIKYSSNE